MKSNCVSPEPKPASGLVPARVLFWRVSIPSLSSAFVQSGSYVLRGPALPQGIPPWEEDGLHAKVWGPHFFCLVISRTLLINSAVISRPCCRMRHNGCSCLRYLSRQISSFFSKKRENRNVLNFIPGRKPHYAKRSPTPWPTRITPHRYKLPSIFIRSALSLSRPAAFRRK